jgi:hypothetical protein
MARLVPHQAARAEWSAPRRRWVCGRCGRRVRFAGGTTPFHRWWWR